MICINCYKVGCVFPVVVYMLAHADFGSNGHRDDVLHFTFNTQSEYQIGTF